MFLCTGELKKESLPGLADSQYENSLLNCVEVLAQSSSNKPAVACLLLWLFRIYPARLEVTLFFSIDKSACRR